GVRGGGLSATAYDRCAIRAQRKLASLPAGPAVECPPSPYRRMDMNRCSAAFVAICALLVTSASFASDKPRIGVADFRNDTAAGWWYGGAGSDLSRIVTNGLSS